MVGARFFRTGSRPASPPRSIAMIGKPVFRLVVLVLGALGLPLPMRNSARTEGDMFFFDDFNGSALDANNWETNIATAGVRYKDGVWNMPPAEATYGSIAVQNSAVNLSNASPTLASPMFPLIWTNHAFPATGDFESEVKTSARK